MDYAISSVSLGHTFGNMTAFMTEYIRGLFPSNYFKTTTIANTIAYKYYNVFDNTNKEFIKKNKPMLIIRPRVDIMNQDVFLHNTMLTNRITDNFYDRDFGNLMVCIEDQTKGLHVRFLPNRMKLYFDVTMIFESQMEQLNQTMYLKNRIRQEHPFVINTALECNIPRQIMEGIATEAGQDINQTKEFLDYINSVSAYPITYKLKNSTGNDEFFRYYPVEIDTLFTGLTTDDGSKKGFVDDSYAVNFTVETEFFTTGLYYFFTKNPDVLNKVTNVSMDISNMDSIIPVFTVNNMFDMEVPPGWTLYASPLYKVESSTKPDVLDISSLLNNSLQSSIDFHIKNGMTMNPMIKFTVFKDNAQLTAGVDFEVDYEKLQLITHRVNTTSTYRLFIHVSMLYINTFIGDLLEFTQEK